jgi:hypothetical protein
MYVFMCACTYICIYIYILYYVYIYIYIYIVCFLCEARGSVGASTSCRVTYSSVGIGRERDGSLRGPALSLARKASQRSARARLIRERVAP